MKIRAGKIRTARGLRGSFTVEAAGVMAVVLFCVMILLDQAFHVRAETVGEFRVHETVERERHLMEKIGENEISASGNGERWSLEVTAPVFRPENALRMWCLLEETE